MGRLNGILMVLWGLSSGSLSAAPPLPLSLTTPDHCFFGRTIVLTGNASDPDDNLDHMEFWARPRHGDPPASWERIGTAYVAGGSAEATITWTPPAVGHYEFYLGVFDEAGESHAEQPEGQRRQYAYLTVESPQPIPKAIKLPTLAEVNSTVTIAASFTVVREHSIPAASYAIGSSGHYGTIQAALNGASAQDMEYVIFELIDDTYAGEGNADITLEDTAIRHFLIIADGGPSDSSVDIKAVQIIQGISVRASDLLVPLVHLNKWRLLVDQYQL